MTETIATPKILDLEKLFTWQNELDTFILESKQLSNVSLASTVNALFVEIGEFLNEVRAFKYWSQKGMSKEAAYEEYIDGLHFLLSIGNRSWDIHTNPTYCDQLSFRLDSLQGRKKPFVYNEGDSTSREAFITQSLQLFNTRPLLHGTLENYFDYFQNYIQLGLSIGMSEEDMMAEYIKKHEKNYKRQKSGNY